MTEVICSDLEVETYLHTMHMELGQTEQFCSKWKGDPFGVSGVDYSSTYSVTSEPLCRLSDAQAIIDGLRGEVGSQRVKTCIALKERNDGREERDAALVECERRQMQLAACGVVALANTIESAGEARQMHPDYMSASCSDVADAVDREIALRTERDRQAQRIGELEGLLRAESARVDFLDAYIVTADAPDTGKAAMLADSGTLRECIDAALSDMQPHAHSGS